MQQIPPDDPIAWEQPFGNGTIIFLPFFYHNNIATKDFLRQLLDKIRIHYKVAELKKVPLWAAKEDYSFERERIIDEQVQKMVEEKNNLVNIKSVLWLDGEALTQTVSLTLNQLGIECQVVEKQGKHDIEIKEKTLRAIVEVKGLSGYANNQDLRQLLDWYGEKLSQDENIKGIFVLNEFKEIEPASRPGKIKEALNSEYPFTKDAIRIAKNNGFCLMTTRYLLSLFKKNIASNFDKKEWLKKVAETTGVLD